MVIDTLLCRIAEALLYPSSFFYIIKKAKFLKLEYIEYYCSYLYWFLVYSKFNSNIFLPFDWPAFRLRFVGAKQSFIVPVKSTWTDSGCCCTICASYISPTITRIGKITIFDAYVRRTFFFLLFFIHFLFRILG